MRRSTRWVLEESGTMPPIVQTLATVWRVFNVRTTSTNWGSPVNDPSWWRTGLWRESLRSSVYDRNLPGAAWRGSVGKPTFADPQLSIGGFREMFGTAAPGQYSQSVRLPAWSRAVRSCTGDWNEMSSLVLWSSWQCAGISTAPPAAPSKSNFAGTREPPP